MLQNRKVIISGLLVIGGAFVDMMYSLLSNIASNILPTGLKPFLWLSLPLLPLFYFVGIKFKKLSDQSTLEKSAATATTRPSPQEPQTPAANQQYQQSTTNEQHHRITTQFQSTSPTLSRPPKQELPAIVDDYDDEHHHFVDDLLPQKPQRVTEPSATELIAALPVMSFEERSKITLPEGPTLVCWSPDGNVLACAFPEHEPMLLSENDTVTLPPDWGWVQELCWSPDGNTLAVSAQGTIHFWDVMSHKESWQPLHLNTKLVYGLDWSVLGQLAVWADSQILLFTSQDLSSPQILKMQNMYCDRTGLLRWSPDGSWLGAGATSSGGKLLCWNIDTQAQQLLQSNLRPLTLAWLPKSSSLIATFSDKRTIIWNADNNQITYPWENLPVTPRTLSISTDQCVVVASNRNELLFGRLDEPFPSSKHKGQLLAVWSPVHSELAILDEQKETLLYILSPRSNHT